MAGESLYEAAPYHTTPRYCHGLISRQIAEQRLMSCPFQNPLLIRQRDNGQSVMSIRWSPNTPSHSLIRNLPNGWLQMDGVPHGHPDIQALVLDYVHAYSGKVTPIASDGSPVPVTTPAQGPPVPHSPYPSAQPNAVPPAASYPSAPPIASPVHPAAYPTPGQFYPPPTHAASAWQRPQPQPHLVGSNGAPPAYNSMYPS